MNAFFGIGNLTRDPEHRTTQGGTTVCTFTIAINPPKTMTGERQDPDFIPIKTFGKRADVCAQYLAKGRKVAVQGRLHPYSYTAQDGSTRYGFEIIANEITFLSSAQGNAGQQGAPAQQYQPPAQNAAQSSAAYQEQFGMPTDDDLPF
jgi:single-strand DNA-binding protein